MTPYSRTLTGKFCFFGFLFVCFSLFLPQKSIAAFVPESDQAIENFKGKWQVIERPERPPVLKFTSGAENELAFALADAPMAWEYLNKVIYMPRTLVNFAVSRNLLDCPDGPLKLWFEDGEFFELGKNSCTEERLYATARTGDRVEDRFRENHLSQILSKHLIVAISQGKKALIFQSEDEIEVEKYQKETDLSGHSAFTKRMRKKWDADLKKPYGKTEEK
ncbi:hypothetical protein FAI40_04545 [Acetobacteraceae bacterium]|nr:hypothetical protein FAI40_04545 [Acetobacteraceae bacterium]